MQPDGKILVGGFFTRLGGGGTAPIAIGYIAQRTNLSMAISLAAVVYLVGAILLLIAALVFAPRDAHAAIHPLSER